MRLIAMCFRNFKRRRLRTILCLSGVALAVTFLVGVGAAILRIMTIIWEMNMLFENEIVVVSRDVLVIQGFPIGGMIPQTVVNELGGIEGVKEVIPMIFNLDLGTKEVSRIFPANITIGLPLEKIPLIFPFISIKGSLPRDQNQVLIGESIADQYDLSVGDVVFFKGKSLTVSGIVCGPSMILSRSIIMSLQLSQEIYRYDMQVSMIVVEPKAAANVEIVACEIENKVNFVMALTENERNELTRPILEELNFWNYGLKLSLSSISALLVAVVQVMNVSESRRDIATLIAIGASKMAILKTVMGEVMLIGLLGGFLGLIFGGVVAVSLASSYTHIPIQMFVHGFFQLVTPYLIIEVLGLTLVTCCISAVIPSLHALRINVNETLRAEY
jgi:ABC-type lipoprotein release transport system permease subunit